MAASEELQTKRITVCEREFIITLMRLSNGCFATITEGMQSRLGSLVLAVKTEARVSSTTVFGGRWDALFSKMTADLLASRLNGIALVSVFMKEELEQEAMRQLFAEVDSFARE